MPHAHVDSEVVAYLCVKMRLDLDMERIFCYGIVGLVPCRRRLPVGTHVGS